MAKTKVSKTKAAKAQPAVAPANNSYPEINDIKQDLDSLKDNVVELTKHLKQNSRIKTKQLKRTAFKKFEGLSDTSKEQLKVLEAKVREEPAKALAFAFVGGVILSALLKRR